MKLWIIAVNIAFVCYIIKFYQSSVGIRINPLNDGRSQLWRATGRPGVSTKGMNRIVLETEEYVRVDGGVIGIGGNSVPWIETLLIISKAQIGFEKVN